MNGPDVRSRTWDPIALAIAIGYLAVATLALWRAGIAVSERSWFELAIAGVLATWFGLRAWDWWQAARARITLDAAVVRRAGRLGWTVLLGDVASYDIAMIWGRPYLVVYPVQAPKRESRSLFLLGNRIEGGCLAGPLDPGLIESVVAGFATATPQIPAASARR